MDFPAPSQENMFGGDTDTDSDSMPAQDTDTAAAAGGPPLPPPAIDPRHGLVELSEEADGDCDADEGGGPPPPVLELMKSVSAELVEESSKKEEAGAEAADDTKEDSKEDTAVGPVLGAAAQVKIRRAKSGRTHALWCVVCSVPSGPHRFALHPLLFAHPPLRLLRSFVALL